MRIFIIILALINCGTIGFSQELTGIWRGSFYNEYEYLFTGSKYRYEVQIKTTDGAVKGVTYSYQTTRFYGKAGAIGKWTPTTKNIILKENKMLDLKITGGGDGCLMTCYLEYRKEGDREFLVGTYTSVNMHNDSLSCGGGVVRLEKVPDSDFTKEEFLKEAEKETKPTAKTPAIKPGQEEFLVKKTPSKQPPVPNAGKKTTTPPPASGNGTKKTTPPPTAKSNTTAKTPPPPAAKPSAPKPNTSSTAKAKPPVNNPQPDKQVAKTDPPKEASADKKLEGTKPADKEVTKVKPVETPSSSIKVPPPRVLKTRTNELVETINTNARDVMVSFYDNGEIDGDTISIYYNNRLLAQHKGLSAKAVQIELKLDENTSVHELVMVAENLGAIPPNTALMIVQAGGERYTLRLSSSEQKNAMVRFNYTGPAPKP